MSYYLLVHCLTDFFFFRLKYVVKCMSCLTSVQTWYNLFKKPQRVHALREHGAAAHRSCLQLLES